MIQCVLPFDLGGGLFGMAVVRGDEFGNARGRQGFIRTRDVLITLQTVGGYAVLLGGTGKQAVYA